MSDRPDVHAFVIVPCRDTREELDGALCTGEFRYGPTDVQAKCTVCGGWRGRYAPADVLLDLADAYREIGRLRALLSDGRTQATEGLTSEVEYAIRWDREDNGTTWYSEPYYRRDLAETHRDGAETVVQRSILAGPWEPAEQTEAAPVVQVVVDPRLHAHEVGGPLEGCAECAAKLAAERAEAGA